jgi:hypothetical protein
MFFWRHRLLDAVEETHMVVVREVYNDGHGHFRQEHLDYVRNMANRVGFTRLNDESEPVAVIKINFPMANPVFRARLEEEASC